MSEKAFVDTAAWIALINRDDALHEQAKTVVAQLRKAKFKLVTTDRAHSQSVDDIMQQLL